MFSFFFAEAGGGGWLPLMLVLAGLGLVMALSQLGYHLYQARHTLMLRVVFPLLTSKTAPRLGGVALVALLVVLAPGATFAAPLGGPSDELKKTFNDGVKNILDLALVVEGGLIMLCLIGGGLCLTVGGAYMRAKQIGAGLIKGAIIGGLTVGLGTVAARIIVQVISGAGGKTIEIPDDGGTTGK